MDEGEVLDRVARHDMLGRKGSVLTREILEHGKHMLMGKRGPKCLACYPTIAMN